ncbi:MAG TPA: hypothetical protein VGL13_09430, partial [Polyangiaceae bacterium]
ELLILAGQRTRMTWALTFGVEIESAPARVPTERISISVRGASPSSSPKPAIVQWQTSRLPLAIAAGVLLVGVGALFLRGRTLTMRIHAGGPNVVLAPTVIDSRASLDSRVADSRRDALGASSASASAFAPTPQEAPPVAAEPRTAEPWTAEAPAPSQEASDWQAASAAQFGFERPALKTTKSRADDRSRRATASRPAPHAAPSHDSDHPPAPPPATDDTASSGPVIGANGAPIFD